MRRALMMVVAGVVMVGSLVAMAAQDEVTFVNSSRERISVLARMGPRGEVGTCEAKEGRASFDLAAGEKKVVNAGGYGVCYCWVREKDGPIKPERDCRDWRAADPGETVEIR